MNKIYLATTFLVLAVGTFAWDTDCTLRTGLQGTACQASKECAEGLSCVSGLCTLVTFESACSSDADCGGDFALCLGGRCDALRIPGDPCTQNLQCTSGSCNDGICLAKSENQACTGGDCAKGLWCDPAQGVCQKRLDDNADCGASYGLMISSNQYSHDLTVMCDGTNVCHAQMTNGIWTGSCQRIFSINTAGSSCSMNLGKWQCNLGYSCTGSSNSMTCQTSQDTTFCSDIITCNGVSEYCLCQSTINGAVPTGATENNNDNGDNDVSVGGDNGVTVGDNGVNVGGDDNGVDIGDNGVSIGGDNGVDIGDNGVSIGGNDGVNIGDNGVNVGGNNGVDIDESGVSIGGSSGVNIGKSVQQFGDTFGFCMIDQCQSNYAQDYYECLLQNDCGLDTTPVLFNNTCASQCLDQYRNLKCCQAGFNVGSAQISSQNNNGRLIVIDNQGLNCQNIQPVQPILIVEESSASQIIASVLGGVAMFALAF